MKKSLKRIVTYLLSIIVSIGLCFVAYAAVVVYSNVHTEHLVALPTKTYDDVTYTGVGGIATGKTRNSMFVMKAESANANSEEQMALFYDFPDISDVSNRHIYRLPHAGHANAMAIDDNNIYICGWTNVDQVGNQVSNIYNNWIIVIYRGLFSGFRDLPDGSVLPMDDPSTSALEGYYILRPMTKEMTSNGVYEFSYYDNSINAITLNGDNGKFIIGYPLSGRGDDMAFTTAALETHNGETRFVVSEENDDIFVVQNNVQNKQAVNQDICYAPGHGLFIPKWYGGGGEDHPYYKPTKNVIMWADIDGDYSSVEINNKTYRYYIPDKINVDKSNSAFEYDGVTYTKFERFEFESIAFTYDGDMLFSCNIINNTDYVNICNQIGKTKYADSVFTLTHDGGQQFVVD